ncbi:MAG: hypothetical protein ACE5O2_02970 [Armatimonadota bacterium]
MRQLSRDMDLAPCDRCGGKHHRLDAYCDETGLPLYRVRSEPRVLDFGILSWADSAATKLLTVRIDGLGVASGEVRRGGDERWLEVSPTRFELTDARAAEIAVTCYPDRIEPGREAHAAIVVEFREPMGMDEAAGITSYVTQVRATRRGAPRLVVEPASVDFALASEELVTKSLRIMNIGQDLLDGHIEMSHGMRTWLRIEPPTPFRLPPGESQVYRITTSRAMIGSTREIMGKVLIHTNDPDAPERLAEVRATTRPGATPRPEKRRPRAGRSRDVLVIDADDLGPQDEESRGKRREQGG